MIITREYVHAHRTAAGGWTKAQLAALGVSWPPTKGWLTAIIGLEITDDQAMRFEGRDALLFAQGET